MIEDRTCHDPSGCAFVGQNETVAWLDFEVPVKEMLGNEGGALNKDAPGAEGYIDLKSQLVGGRHCERGTLGERIVVKAG